MGAITLVVAVAWPILWPMLLAVTVGAVAIGICDALCDTPSRSPSVRGGGQPLERLRCAEDIALARQRAEERMRDLRRSVEERV